MMTEIFLRNKYCCDERMCEVALIGARCDAGQLRSVLSGPCDDGELDMDAVPDPAAVRCFPDGDEIVALTLGACSCELLRGQGSTQAAHLARPAYAFRRALAGATLRFGSLRLLIHHPGRPIQFDRARATTLSQFLRAPLVPGDALLFIRA